VGASPQSCNVGQEHPSTFEVHQSALREPAQDLVDALTRAAAHFREPALGDRYRRR
jgi:hypothetical protein